MTAQRDLATQQEIKAMKKYNALYNNVTFTKATQGKSTQYANALIDESLAICGSPYYKLSYRRWGKDALAHLASPARVMEPAWALAVVAAGPGLERGPGGGHRQHRRADAGQRGDTYPPAGPPRRRLD